MEFMSNFLQILLEAMLPFLVASLIGWLSSKAIILFKSLKDKNPQLYEILTASARTAVNAAEQIYVGQKRGEEKRAYAIATVEKYLRLKGLNIDVSLIVAEIESQVHQMNVDNYYMLHYPNESEE